MRTTMLYVEFLVGGILVLLALIFLGISIFPSMENPIMNLFEQKGYLSASILLSPILVAAAYAIGVFSEYFTRSLFENKLDEIKVMRTKTYLKENYCRLWRSPILAEYLRVPPKKIDEKIDIEEARKCIGPMRYYVMMENSELYREIESHLHKLRLARTQFLVVVILMLAVFFRLQRALHLQSDDSLVLVIVLEFLALAAIATFKAVMDRSDRYCRAVERSYRALVLDR